MVSLNRYMSASRLPFPLSALFWAYRSVSRLVYRLMPKGIYWRALLIIILPIIILQSVLVFVFMERHYDLISRRMSDAIVREIAVLVYTIENFPAQLTQEHLEPMSNKILGLSASLLPLEPLPPPTPKPYFDIIDRELSRSISQKIGKPFWIDTVGRSSYVEIRIKLEHQILRIFARRSQTFASNSHIFLVWMFSTSLVLIIIAMVFLRNQVRPIIKLSNAAEAFGMGRPIDNYHPSGAREVRKAGTSFLEMRRRIERQIEQRTTMLAGVSHDLRTILTRMRLQLALLERSPECEAMQKDVDEMTHMLEDYMAFAKGDVDEAAEACDMALMFEEIEEEAEISGINIKALFDGESTVRLRRLAMKRCLSNLVTNAGKFGSCVEMNGESSEGWLTITIDDDGPGIPEAERADAFRAFHRLDSSRNQDTPGSGLGLAIARDIARSHGGDIQLDHSPLGGLRASLRIPV